MSKMASGGLGLGVALTVLGLGLFSIVIHFPPPPVPDGSPAHPLRAGNIDLVFFEGNCTVRGLPTSVETQTPRQEVWLEQGNQVLVRVLSEDFVYAVQQPLLEVNVVAVPGLDSVLDLNSAQPGRYELQLNPLCGTPWRHPEPPAVIVIAPVHRDR